MKRILFTLASLFLCAVSFAETVSEQRAMEFAQKYFGGSPAIAVRSQKFLAAAPAGAAAYHIFNNPAGGWVIVAGDDRVKPVLAYSKEGSFRLDGMPGNIAFWLKDLEAAILSADDRIVQSEKTKKAWAGELSGMKYASPSKVLETALWDQGSPYNASCNTATGASVYTGCAATAISIVLRYNRWPEKGKGTIPSYTTYSSRYRISAVNIDGYTYEWDKMPISNGAVRSNNWTSEQKKAVAEFTFHCGAMIKMDYTSGGSGAYSKDIVPALTKYMSYSREARYILRRNLPVSRWMEMIRAEIDADRPVLYGGYGSDGGHEFVCDGYDMSDNTLHFNWGWGGADNGFFTVDLEEVNFPSEQDAIFGLVPDPSQTSAENQEIIMGAVNNGSYGDGIKLVSGSVSTGTSFTISANYFFHYGESQYKGAVKAALVDRKGNLKEFISSEYSLTLNNLYSSTNYISALDRIECTIKGDTAFGDRVVLYFKNTVSGEWMPITCDYEKITYAAFLPVYDIAYIEALDAYGEGDAFYFSLSRGQRAIRSAEWYFDDVVVSGAAVKSVVLTRGSHSVKVKITYSDGSNETLQRNIRVS